ncbi:hypothetical protein RND81_01G181200 [Saponaria officinalis]|uniref:Pentatricopeptide repeat-containing protein n=1 Tax=Saponaria officinalis TaxID=3572 RepID=A0AAW1NAR1_SAPOF
MLQKFCFSLRCIRRFSVTVNCSIVRCYSSNRSCDNRKDLDTLLSNCSGETQMNCDFSSSNCSGVTRFDCDFSSSNCSGETRIDCDISSSNCSGETRIDCDISPSNCSGETRTNCDFSSSSGETRINCDVSSSSGETQINCDCLSTNCGSIKCSDNKSLTSDDVKIRTNNKLEEPALIKLKNERDPERLFRLFKENSQNRLVVENKYAFEDTVSRLAGAGRYDYIEHLLEHQKSLPQGRREGFVVRIIMLYGRAGMVRHAVDTFYSMHLFRCRRTVKSLNATLKVLTQTRDLEAIRSFLKEAPCEFGVELDVVSMNIVVSAFCQMGILDKAYLLMVEMEKRGTLCDVVTFTTLISAFYKCGRWEIGNGLWNLMVYKGCRPNVATFNARIQFLISRGRAWQANDLLCFMEELGMPPDEVTYNLVIKGFFEASFIDMAQRVYSALHGRGCKANLKICQTMVHYLCKVGDFDSAYNMCKDCLKKNWILNVGTICTLLKGLKSLGKAHNAWMIIGLAERRRPPFLVEQLDAFKSILGKR